MAAGNETNATSDSIYDKLIKILHRIYIDLRRNILLLLLCLGIPCAVLIYMNYSKSNIYHSSFTVTYEELVRKVYGDRLSKLNKLIHHNPGKAKILLGVDSKTLSILKEVEGTNILGENLARDMNTDKIPFTVHIYISDTTYVKEIQNAIVNYLENGNAFLIDKRKLKIQETADELAFIDKQLAMMDTLKRKYNRGMEEYDKSDAKATSLYEFSYELYKKRQDLIKKRDMPMNLYVIDDAIIPVANNRSYFFVLPLGIIAGIIIYIGLVYILLPVVRYKGD